LIAKASQPVIFKPLLPDLEKMPGDTEEMAGLTNVAAQARRMLKHAEPASTFPV
jgi:hypothetical protein